MKYYTSHGGDDKPYFKNRIKVIDGLAHGAYEWCREYPDENQPFRRFHCEWDHFEPGQTGHKGYVVIQFEWEQAAIMFALRWL